MTAEERAVQLRALAEQVWVCTQCRLSLTRRCAVPGEGEVDSHLFWVGEAPGSAEDATGRPFVGPSGHLLRREMDAVGIAPATSFISSVTKCRPPANRTPRVDEVAICTTLYLARQIEWIRPRAIVALGATAAGALLADPVKMTVEHGTWRRDYALTGQSLPVFLTYHPAAALRSERWREEMRADLSRLKEEIP
jgi:uracil-DNA glycosylase